MPVQAIGPAVPAVQEFHPISIVLAEDTTEVTCAACGPLEHTGTGTEGQAAHGAAHSIVTGHTVSERHVRLTVISERRARPGEIAGTP